MKSPICEMLGIEFPLFAFSHCRDVVAAVSRAGGFGVFGATGHTPASIHAELTWIDDHCGGKEPCFVAHQTLGVGPVKAAGHD